MAFDYSKLRGRIIEKYGSCRRFAREIGASEQIVSLKLRGERGFTQADIKVWAEALDIDSSEYGTYFFTLVV